MDENNLPVEYRRTSQLTSKEEYQQGYLPTIANVKEETRWLIRHLYNSLEKMSFRVPPRIKKKELKKLNELEERRSELLDTLRVTYINIKRDTNQLLTGIAKSSDGRWDDFYLMDVKSYQTDNLNEPEKDSIPLPLQSMVFRLSGTFLLLVKVAINTMLLQIEATECFADRTKQKGGANPDLIEIIERCKDLYALGQNMLNSTKQIESKADKIDITLTRHDDRSIRGRDKLAKKIDKFVEMNKYPQLTQKTCAGIIWKIRIKYARQAQDRIDGVFNRIIKKPKVATVESIEREIQRWEQFLNADETERKGTPPPRDYSRSKKLYAFVEWAKEVEHEKFLNWLEYNHLLNEEHEDGQDEDMESSPDIMQKKEEQKDITE